jgi:hypothetical protein
MEHEAHRGREPRRLLLAQWLGVLVAPAVWFLHLNFSYVLGAYACARDMSWLLHLATVAALALGAAGLAAGWWALRAAGRASRDRGEAAQGRPRFLALGGVALSAYFLLLIGASELNNLVLDPCGAR